MNTDNTQGAAEPSPASAGSQAVAWWVTLPGRDFPYLSHIQDRALFCQKDEPGSEVIPLYRSPTLTNAEREAIQTAAMVYEQGAKQMGHVEDGKRAVALRAMLERLG